MISLVGARQCLKIVWNPIFGWRASIHLQLRENRAQMMMLHHRHCSVSTMNAIKLFSNRSVKYFTSLRVFHVCSSVFSVIFLHGMLSLLGKMETVWIHGTKSQSSVQRVCVSLHHQRRGRMSGKREKIENSTKIFRRVWMRQSSELH